MKDVRETVPYFREDFQMFSGFSGVVAHFQELFAFAFIFVFCA